MKRIATLIAILATLGCLAQQKVAERIQELKSMNTNFKHFSVLDVSSQIPQDGLGDVVRNATLAKIRLASVNTIVSQANETIELEIPFKGQTIIVQLYKVKVLHDSFHLDTDKAKNVPFERGVHYRGIVNDDMNSIVSMNFFNGQFNGIIASQELNNVVVGKLDRVGNSQDYIVYSDADLLIDNISGCELPDEAAYAPAANQTQSEQSIQSVLSSRCATVYLELDNQLYIQNGNNAGTANTWITSVFNNVQTLYANADINVALKSVFVWTTADPFTGTTSTARMNSFNQFRPVFDGDIGQLVAIDPGSLGGVASAVNGICGPNNFSYADIDFGYNAVPTYSWTVQVITHELGHLMGSPHTHSCVWNGNNTAIDNCGPSAIPNSEGASCMTSPPTIPTAVVKGTIMSYCHLVGGVGINFSNGFGPQPASRILTTVNGATCLSVDCVNTCINTAVNMHVDTVTSTTANLSWDDIGDVGTWQIAVSPLSGSSSWTTVTSNAYLASGLQPNTYYKLRIKPSCDSGMTSSYRQLVFATGADWCSGVTITDTGGATANYFDSQEFVRVIMPTQANKKIKITFTSFATETNYDFLWMYNGSSTSSPVMGTTTGYTGNVSPGTFTSSAADGALTLKFRADNSTNAAGFVANVVCESTLGTGDVSRNIDFTYYPNPANNIVNISSASEAITQIQVYSVTGQLLFDKKLNGLEEKVDVSSFATGTYFFKLKFGSTEANFKILKQ
ncbi:M12 family metallo-peptidase [Flavobacterium silvaticum]|uniref:T9SS type A sorting domain-containing protein n=1 Tax=Flavobacterium silvaticum TaxID=1852020 RepID=A0A972JJN5_9FLAO|nr:M12 family metallo-peptidase [Flavobacterium silvaticum]NMH28287.1 T9SS type A sorting domain-containing protein [Flavobacterium silvaticum]